MSETSESDAKVTLEAEKPLKARLASFKTRLIWSLIMAVGFIAIIAAGHFYCCLLVLVTNMYIFREIISLRRDQTRDKKLPYFYVINWYFFFLTFFSFSITFLKDKILTLMSYAQADTAVRYFHLVFFSLYVLGIVIFVISLRRGQLRYQFIQFGWTHCICLLVVVQSASFTVNIYSGLIWFLLPTSLVIINDSFAYIFGFFFGRTPLIKISPKKTWEGFIGGLMCTIIWAFYVTPTQFSQYLSTFDYLICQPDSITLTPFQTFTCTRDDFYIVKERPFPQIFSYFGLTTGIVSGLQMHAMVLGCFAGFIAPFGGFFASGFKRAFKIKDFGDSIPGHGGVTDRMDCQLLMGMFTCVWQNAMMSKAAPSLNLVLQYALLLPAEDRQRLISILGAQTSP